jgi:PKD repeat protein
MPIVADAGQLFAGPVASFTASDPLSQPGDFIATVQWGDGSFLELATVRFNQAGAGFEVFADHTYADGGDYPVTITVVSPGGGASTVVSTADVSGGQQQPPATPPSISGDLAPESDRGIFNNDRVTSDNQPTLWGTATASTTWTITATSVGGRQAAEVE